jgi:hypothetical protein
MKNNWGSNWEGTETLRFSRGWPRVPRELKRKDFRLKFPPSFGPEAASAKFPRGSLQLVPESRTYRGNTSYWIELKFNDKRRKLKIGQASEGYPALRENLISVFTAIISLLFSSALSGGKRLVRSARSRDSASVTQGEQSTFLGTFGDE